MEKAELSSEGSGIDGSYGENHQIDHNREVARAAFIASFTLDDFIT